MSLSLEEVTTQMKESAAEFIGIESDELDVNKKLRLEYGVSSVDAAELIMLMEDTYGLKIPVEEAEKILSTQDAIEYIMAGATAVGIGTAWFVNPNIFKDIYCGIKAYLKNGNTTIMDTVGIAHEAEIG